VRIASLGVALACLSSCQYVNLDGPSNKVAGRPETIAKVDDARITESSGLAESLNRPGTYWTHNDSDKAATLYRFGADGKVQDVVRVEGAKNVDWEDMAAARIDGKPYLFVGDIGDNNLRRSEIIVYRIPEPGIGDRVVSPDHAYRLRYPDRRWNAETLMVHPQTGELYIVVKSGQGGSGVYRARIRSSSATAMKRIGALEVGGFIRESRRITGGAISPDGKRVAIRTYLGAYLFNAPADFDKWVDEKPQPIRTALEPQGEAITFSADGRSLLTTSEGRPMPLNRIPIP